MSYSVLHVKAVVAAFNQEKALVGGRGLLRDCTTGCGSMDRFTALVCTRSIISNHITRLAGHQCKHASSRGRGQGNCPSGVTAARVTPRHTNPGSGNHNERGFLHLISFDDDDKLSKSVEYFTFIYIVYKNICCIWKEGLFLDILRLAIKGK